MFIDSSLKNQDLEINCLYKTIRLTTFWGNIKGHGETYRLTYQVFLVLKIEDRANSVRSACLYKVLVGDKIMYLKIAPELNDIYLIKID